MKIIAPGKLILSGEHAVLYGCPALGMAINRYMTVNVSTYLAGKMFFDLSDLGYQAACNISQLLMMRPVLEGPHVLAHAAVGSLLNEDDKEREGLHLQVQSDLPVGAGLGSSAAIILCIMRAVSQAWKLSHTLAEFLTLARSVENLQHGVSSGFDLHIISQGGCIYRQGDQYAARPPISMPLYLVQTGRPQTTTGECVEKAAAHFVSEELRAAFTGVTQEMDAALGQASHQAMRATLRENHRLLVQIGVVPPRVQNFIAQVEKLGGAAKICGAGAVRGDAAGVILVAIDAIENLVSLCKQMGYVLMPIRGESLGVRCVT